MTREELLKLNDRLIDLHNGVRDAVKEFGVPEGAPLDRILFAYQEAHNKAIDATIELLGDIHAERREKASNRADRGDMRRVRD